MRDEKQNELTKQIWRQRFRIAIWPGLSLLLVGIVVLALFFDPRKLVGYKAGNIVSQKRVLGKYVRMRQFLNVELQDGGVIEASPIGIEKYRDGQSICVAIFQGLIFGGSSAEVVDEEKCSDVTLLPRV